MKKIIIFIMSMFSIALISCMQGSDADKAPVADDYIHPSQVKVWIDGYGDCLIKDLDHDHEADAITYADRYQGNFAIYYVEGYEDRLDVKKDWSMLMSMTLRNKATMAMQGIGRLGFAIASDEYARKASAQEQETPLRESFVKIGQTGYSVSGVSTDAGKALLAKQLFLRRDVLEECSFSQEEYAAADEYGDKVLLYDEIIDLLVQRYGMERLASGVKTESYLVGIEQYDDKRLLNIAHIVAAYEIKRIQ